MRTVPTTATMMRKTPRTRVRASPKPASRTACHLRRISHPLLRRADAPSHSIVIVQRPVVRGNIRVDAVHVVQPVPPLTIDRSVDRRDEDSLWDLVPNVGDGEGQLRGGLEEQSEGRIVVRREGLVQDRPAGAFYLETHELDRGRPHRGRLQELRRGVQPRDGGDENRGEKDGLLPLAQLKGHGVASVETRTLRGRQSPRRPQSGRRGTPKGRARRAWRPGPQAIARVRTGDRYRWARTRRRPRRPGSRGYTPPGRARTTRSRSRSSRSGHRRSPARNSSRRPPFRPRR